MREPLLGGHLAKALPVATRGEALGEPHGAGMDRERAGDELPHPRSANAEMELDRHRRDHRLDHRIGGRMHDDRLASQIRGRVEERSEEHTSELQSPMY